MNLKEQCKAIILRNGKLLEDQRPKTNQKIIDETSGETDTQVKREEIQANKGKEKEEKKKEKKGLPKP